MALYASKISLSSAFQLNARSYSFIVFVATHHCNSKNGGGCKTSSSKWLKKQDASLTLFQWQAGYGAFSISTNQIKTVRQYIENQQIHHQTQNFQEEFLWLLQKHDVSYDPKYVWD